MSVFTYIALSKEGRQTSGTLTADSRAAAIAQIGKQGLHPVSLDEARDAAAAARKAAVASGRVGKVSHSAVESFTRELANLLAGGVPLSRALALLRREAATPAARSLWGAIHDDVVGGTSLADALAKWPANFSNIYVAMVRAGEAGGFLDVVLAQISDFRIREQELMGKIKAAMIYPIILGILAIGVVIFMLSYFIPQFRDLFNSMGGHLPGLTRFIIAASDLVKHYGLWIGGGVVVLVIIVQRILRTEGGLRAFEVMVLNIPVLGRIVAQFAMVRFTRMLGTLLGAGVPLLAALKVARDAIGNQTLSDTVLKAIEEVRRGSALSKSLVGSAKLFPPSVVEMVAVAEETGRLDKELIRLATSYEMGLDRQLRMLVSIVEPLMLFVMAALIGTIVLGMLLPILNLQDLIH